MKELDLAAIKKFQMEILGSVHDHCQLHGIRYSLSFGTLLGAVRHQGYIPWDDDIDLMMPRPDYVKFVETFKNQDGVFRVCTSDTDGRFPYPFAKVEHRKTKLKEYVGIDYDIGVNIDVFPVDGIPSDEREFEKYFKNLKFYRDLWIVKMIKLDFTNRGFLKNTLLMAMKACLSVVSIKSLVKKIQSKITKYDFDQSELAMISCIQETTRKQKAKKSWHEEFQQMEFEGQNFIAITHTDEYLTMQYGDYMRLPPEEDRVSHHNYKAYG